MLIHDHNQVQRPFSFKHYRKLAKVDDRVCHCWFSRQQAFDNLVNNKSASIAVYRSTDYDSYLLATRARELPKTLQPLWNVDWDDPASVWEELPRFQAEYQGLGVFYCNVFLTLMVEAQHACLDDLNAIHKVEELLINKELNSQRWVQYNNILNELAERDHLHPSLQGLPFHAPAHHRVEALLRLFNKL